MSDLDRELAKLSSAEDFFERFGVAFDAHVVAVNRLHILKRCNQYLAKCDIDGMDDEAKTCAYREALAKAHADFVNSSAQAEKVFPIFRPRGEGFVALEAVRGGKGH